MTTIKQYEYTFKRYKRNSLIKGYSIIESSNGSILDQIASYFAMLFLHLRILKLETKGGCRTK
jgi:hypothetical protein